MRNINIDKTDELPKCTHGAETEHIHVNMPGLDDLYDLAELFKIFGDSTRIRILYALFDKRLLWKASSAFAPVRAARSRWMASLA